MGATMGARSVAVVPSRCRHRYLVSAEGLLQRHSESDGRENEWESNNDHWRDFRHRSCCY